MEQLPAGAEKLPTCNPPCRSVLTVVLTSEARLYRYLTCGGQSTKSWKSFWKDLHFVEKVSGIETQGRAGGLGHCSRVSRVKQSESAESSVEDCLIGVSAAPTFALPPVPFCQTPTKQQQKAQDANARPNKLEKPSRSDDTHLRLTQTDSRVKIEIWEAGKAAEECLEKRLKRAQNPTMGACNAMQCNASQERDNQRKLVLARLLLLSGGNARYSRRVLRAIATQTDSGKSIFSGTFFVLSTSSLLSTLSVPWTKY